MERRATERVRNFQKGAAGSTTHTSHRRQAPTETDEVARFECEGVNYEKITKRSTCSRVSIRSNNKSIMKQTKLMSAVKDRRRPPAPDFAPPSAVPTPRASNVPASRLLFTAATDRGNGNDDHEHAPGCTLASRIAASESYTNAASSNAALRKRRGGQAQGGRRSMELDSSIEEDEEKEVHVDSDDSVVSVSASTSASASAAPSRAALSASRNLFSSGSSDFDEGEAFNAPSSPPPPVQSNKITSYFFSAAHRDEEEESEEDVLFRSVGNKVRRLNLGPDDASSSASSAAVSSTLLSVACTALSHRQCYSSLSVRTKGIGGGVGGKGGMGSGIMGAILEEGGEEGDEVDARDRISPTEVLGFPFTGMAGATAKWGSVSSQGQDHHQFNSPPGTPARSGYANENAMMQAQYDGGCGYGDKASADHTPAAPGTPKISRSSSARSDNAFFGASGNGSYHYGRKHPGTPTLEDRLGLSLSPSSDPSSSQMVTSRTPYRAGRGEGPPGTPAVEKRLGTAPVVIRRRRGLLGSPESSMTMDSAAIADASTMGRFETDFEVVGRPLGKGSFGTVYKCLSRLDGCTYAIKVANRRIKGVADRSRMLREVCALAAVCDRAETAAFHIVRYHQAWMEDGRLHIQTELCSSTLRAEMDGHVWAKSAMSLRRRYKLLREIILALELLHKNDMVHLDIKPENIFIKSDQFKLGDFGLVSKITTDSEIEEGDCRYMSLEVLRDDHVDLTKVSLPHASVANFFWGGIARARWSNVTMFPSHSNDQTNLTTIIPTLSHLQIGLTAERHFLTGGHALRDLPWQTPSGKRRGVAGHSLWKTATDAGNPVRARGPSQEYASSRS